MKTTENQQISLIGLLTGTISGYVKYSDMSIKEKKLLAKQLKWCYEQAQIEMSATLLKEIDEIISA